MFFGKYGYVDPKEIENDINGCDSIVAISTIKKEGVFAREEDAAIRKFKTKWPNASQITARKVTTGLFEITSVYPSLTQGYEKMVTSYEKELKKTLNLENNNS